MVNIILSILTFHFHFQTQELALQTKILLLSNIGILPVKALQTGLHSALYNKKMRIIQ